MDVNLGQKEVIKYYYRNHYYYYYNTNILRYTIMFPTDKSECSTAGSGRIFTRTVPVPTNLKVRWNSESVWTLWREEKALRLQRIELKFIGLLSRATKSAALLFTF